MGGNLHKGWGALQLLSLGGLKYGSDSSRKKDLDIFKAAIRSQVKSSQSLSMTGRLRKSCKFSQGMRTLFLHAFDKNTGWDIVIVTGKVLILCK